MIWDSAQRLLAAAALVLLLPVLALVALAVRLDSRGPILYAAQRVGRCGHAILVHKFRTMRWPPDGPAITGRRDPRVTPVGRFLRRSRVDELPQLWDVVRGEMSLVGPRPETPAMVDVTDERWLEVLSVRPGITGPTQLAFRHEALVLDSGDPEAVYRERLLPAKLASDLAYVRSRSWRTDLGWLIRTVKEGARIR